MSGPDAVPDEMPEFSLSGRGGLELDEQLLDTILSGQQLSPEAPGQAIKVAEMLSSLAKPVYSGHLAGEEAARSAFARAVSPALAPRGRRGRHASPAVRRLRGSSPRPARPAPARPAPARRPGRVSIRLASALAATTAVLSGTVAAYAGALPAPVQDLAHYTIGAPSANQPRGGGQHHGGHPKPGLPPGTSPSPTGSTTTGPAQATGKPSSSTNPAGKARGKGSANGNGASHGKGNGSGNGASHGNGSSHGKATELPGTGPPPGKAKGHAPTSRRHDATAERG